MLETPEPGTIDNRPSSRPGLTLLLITGIQLMLVLDSTIVNIALPQMGDYFGESQANMTWAVTAYGLAFGGFLLLGGRAGDIFGRRRMLTIGLTIFTIASLIGGMSSEFVVLVACRALQGLGGCLAAPAALALLTSEFSEGRERTRALAVYSSVQGWGSAFGLLLGGVLVEYVSWRWVMFVNVPLGAIMIAGTLAYLRASERTPGRFDWWGALLSTAGMTSLVYGFISAGKNGWEDGVTIGSFVAAALLLASFVLVESRTPHAMVPLRLFRDRNRASAYVAMLTITAGLAGQFFFVTYFYQRVLGFTALQNGFASIPVGIMVAVGAYSSGKLLPRIGSRGVVVVGAVFCCTGLFWLSTMTGDTTYFSTVLPAILLFSFGTGNMLVPLTTAAMSGLQLTEMGVGGAVVNVAGQVGGAVGIAALTSVSAANFSATAVDQVDALAQATGSALLAAGLFILFGGIVAFVLIRTRPAGDSVESVATT